MIRLPYNYGIKADTYGYTVGKIISQVNQKTGANEEVLQNTSYYATVKDCVEKVLWVKQKEIVALKDLTLKQTIEEFSKLQKEFVELLGVIPEKL